MIRRPVGPAGRADGFGLSYIPDGDNLETMGQRVKKTGKSGDLCVSL